MTIDDSKKGSMVVLTTSARTPSTAVVMGDDVAAIMIVIAYFKPLARYALVSIMYLLVCAYYLTAANKAGSPGCVQLGRGGDKQGRIHGYQLRRGGQGRKCAFLHSLNSMTSMDRLTDRRTN